MVFFVLHSGKDKVSVCVCVGGLHFALLSPPFLAMLPLFSKKKFNFKSVIHAFLARDDEIARRLGWVMIIFAESLVNETLALADCVVYTSTFETNFT